MITFNENFLLKDYAAVFKNIYSLAAKRKKSRQRSRENANAFSEPYSSFYDDKLFNFLNSLGMMSLIVIEVVMFIGKDSLDGYKLISDKATPEQVFLRWINAESFSGASGFTNKEEEVKFICSNSQLVCCLEEGLRCLKCDFVSPLSNETSYEVFSENLKYYLETFGKSQVEVAAAVGVSRGTFSDWVNGRGLPRSVNINLLADYFNVTVGDLLEKHSDESVYFTNKLVSKIAQDLYENVEARKLYSKIRCLSTQDYELINGLVDRLCNNGQLGISK